MSIMPPQSLTAAIKPLPKHLKRLEAELIEIMREVVAEFRKPVMLYSIGKDSSVMLHWPSRPFIRRHCPFHSCMSTRPGSSGR